MRHNEYASVLALARKVANDMAEADAEDEQEKREREQLDVLAQRRALERKHEKVRLPYDISRAED